MAQREGQVEVVAVDPAGTLAGAGSEFATDVTTKGPTSVAARTTATAEPPMQGTLAEGPNPSKDLTGVVVDEEEQPIAGAQVYLVASGVAGQGNAATNLVRMPQESDSLGRFRFASGAWQADNAEGRAPPDLGVVANGFLRKVVSLVESERSGEDLRVVLERGRTVSGRVVDKQGQPVVGLELLAHTAYAGIGHVSPSQRLLLRSTQPTGRCLLRLRPMLRHDGRPRGGPLHGLACGEAAGPSRSARLDD